jgi:hypothetical protein
MLGDEREQSAFDKFEAAEEPLTRKECQEADDPECRALSVLVKKHVETIREHAKALSAGKACKEDASCWSGKLRDQNPEIRQRAALEVGRSRKSQYLKDLIQRVRDQNLEVRSTAIQAANWLIVDSADAAVQARTLLPEIETQLTEEKSRTEFARVNEDLRRLAVQIGRAAR